MRVVAVIPARYASVRLPGKALLEIAGRPMIAHVYERVARCTALAAVIVATDDERIAQAIRALGGAVAMTRPDHPSGTDRVAEVAQGLAADLIINVQGDEPLFKSQMIDDALAPFRADAELRFGTLRATIRETDDLFDPNCVKVVVDQQDHALYFSRSPIPFARGLMSLYGQRPELVGAPQERPVFYKHLGLYVYRRDFLLEFTRWPASALERAERLEQLRALEHGVRIACPLTVHETISVDTAHDLTRVKAIMENG
jgi:3-deoxy-manno-octulosonate cytidylyltransferase (CMP-KDO synthetase)